MTATSLASPRGVRWSPCSHPGERHSRMEGLGLRQGVIHAEILTRRGHQFGSRGLPQRILSPRSHGLSSTGSQVLPRHRVHRGFGWPSCELLLLHVTYGSTSTDDAHSNRIALLDASHFVRGLPSHTLAFHSGHDHGWHLDPASPLALGEKSELRGYGRLAVDRRLPFDIEDRLFIHDEVWSPIDIGAAVFCNSDNVWTPGGPVRFSKLMSSLGLDLRPTPSRPGGNSPVRIELACAMSDNQGRSRWLLSGLGGPACGPGSNCPVLDDRLPWLRPLGLGIGPAGMRFSPSESIEA